MQHSLDASQRAYLAITILLFIILVLLLCRRTFSHQRKRLWKAPSSRAHAQLPLFNEKKPISRRRGFGTFLSAGFWVGFFGTPAWESKRYHRNAEAGPRFHHLLTTRDAETIRRARIRIPPPLPAYIPPSRSVQDIAYETPTPTESPARNHDSLQLGLYPASEKLQGPPFSNPAPRAGPLQPQCTHLHSNGCLCFRLPDITIHTVDSSTPSISVTPIADSSLLLDCHGSSSTPKDIFPEEEPSERKHAVDHDSLEAPHKSPPSFKSPTVDELAELMRNLIAEVSDWEGDIAMNDSFKQLIEETGFLNDPSSPPPEQFSKSKHKRQRSKRYTNAHSFRPSPRRLEIIPEGEEHTTAS